MATDAELDLANAEFWNELCGSELARRIGLQDDSPAELSRFDAAYMALYPYLASYLETVSGPGRVLEVGTGYGTVGRRLIADGATYHAVDVAPGPVAMARLSLVRGRQDPDQAALSSVLSLPFEDAMFDAFVAIGSLHHTGNLPRALAELRRVSKPGARAVVMVYNARSPNRLVTTPIAHAVARILPEHRDHVLARTSFDRDSQGHAAPHTDYLTRAELRNVCSTFAEVEVSSENANVLSVFGRVIVPRRLLLPTLGRFAGLDLYAKLRV